MTAVAVLFGSQTAGAQAADVGNQGNIVITNDTIITLVGSNTLGDLGDVSVQSVSVNNQQAVTAFALKPSVDFMVVQNVSVGGAVLFAHGSQGDASATALGLAPRAGYHYAFNDKFSIWPRGGFAIQSISVSFPGPQPNTSISNSASAFELALDAPILYHPAEHFFFGLGPVVQLPLAGDLKFTEVGVAMTIGGWL